MKEIRLKQLSLLNFKGVASLTIDFVGQETSIGGANGTGKTTIFDAFTWLLFGKDSQDRKEFDIKTFDANGKCIHKLPHEVSAVLDVDGDEIKLRKVYAEKWVKRSGELEEVLTGNTVECYYNDVPIKISEYTARIADICPEQTFKLITNPQYFTSQKPDTQRAMLFNLAGEITNQEIVANNPDQDFEEVLKLLTGKTANDLKKEIAAKKKTIKSNVETIPTRIDELKRRLALPKDWHELEVAIQNLDNVIEEVNQAIKNRNSAYDLATSEQKRVAQQISNLNAQILTRKNEINKTIDNLKVQISTRKNTIKSTTDEANRVRKEEYDRLHRLESELLRRKAAIESQIKASTERLESAKAEREELLAEYHKVSAETFVLDETALVCPTCGATLQEDVAMAKREQLQANFNNDKMRRLERNKASGLNAKNVIELETANLANYNETLVGVLRQIKETTTAPAYVEEPKQQDVNTLVENDTEIKQWQEQIKQWQAVMDNNSDEKIVAWQKEAEKLQAKLDANEVVAPDCSDLLEKRGVLEDEKSAKKVELSEREIIKKDEERIKELQAELRLQQEELAKLERTEYSVFQFTKARAQAVEERVNGMFRFVKFQLFDTQINGNEVEVCEATANGVPFRTANQALQLNIGLDIINTICNKEGISAPIMIDNRESVTKIDAPENSQIVSLYVKPECKTLTIL